jgi:hypothetical protein
MEPWGIAKNASIDYSHRHATHTNFAAVVEEAGQDSAALAVKSTRKGLTGVLAQHARPGRGELIKDALTEIAYTLVAILLFFI